MRDLDEEAGMVVAVVVEIFLNLLQFPAKLIEKWLILFYEHMKYCVNLDLKYCVNFDP